MSDDWQAEQFRDECERMRQVIQALEAAEKAGTPRDAVLTLADETGVGEFYRKHYEPNRKDMTCHASTK